MLRLEGSPSSQGPVCCVHLVFIISKSIFMELACFCSVNQDLLLFKYVENNANGFNNWDDFFFFFATASPK